jgi:hypothetical protein
VFNLAKDALELFESSEVPQKRAILNYILSNYTVNEKTPCITMRSPFKELLSLTTQPIGLDMVRDIGTFWKTNKEHIWLPNIKQGFFGIVQPTEAEMAEYR